MDTIIRVYALRSITLSVSLTRELLPCPWCKEQSLSSLSICSLLAICDFKTISVLTKYLFHSSFSSHSDKKNSALMFFFSATLQQTRLYSIRFGLVVVYGIPYIVDYLMQNLIYAYVLNMVFKNIS